MLYSFQATGIPALKELVFLIKSLLSLRVEFFLLRKKPQKVAVAQGISEDWFPAWGLLIRGLHVLHVQARFPITWRGTAKKWTGGFIKPSTKRSHTQNLQLLLYPTFKLTPLTLRNSKTLTLTSKAFSTADTLFFLPYWDIRCEAHPEKFTSWFITMRIWKGEEQLRYSRTTKRKKKRYDHSCFSNK